MLIPTSFLSIGELQPDVAHISKYLTRLWDIFIDRKKTKEWEVTIKNKIFREDLTEK